MTHSLRHSLSSCVVAAGILAGSGLASAQPLCPCVDAEPEGRWTITPMVGTLLPIAVGGGFLIEAPAGVRLDTFFGFTPSAYVDVINWFMQGVGNYGQGVANLTKAILPGAFVWRTNLGWRPWLDHGFYVAAGYQRMMFGSHGTPEGLIATATGAQTPDAEVGGPHTFSVDTKLHQVDVEVGWEWHIGMLMLRAGANFFYTVGSRTTITPEFVPAAAGLTDAFLTGAADRLDRIYSTKVFGLTSNFMAGFTF